MDPVNDIEMQMANLDIDNKENEELVFDERVEEESNRFDLCLVGQFLIKKSINIIALKTKMTDIWRPAMGITIRDPKPGLFLF